MTLRPQACPLKIRIPICLPREHQAQLPWFAHRWQSLVAVRCFQEADSYECFASRNLASHNFECVLIVKKFTRDPFHSGNSTLRILILCFQKQNASFEHKRRSVYGVQLHKCFYQNPCFTPKLCS